ncbi:MAG: tyrosine-protein phosphatase [Rhodococcus sp.]|uniref:tyrosine-protein phosphatase n=1 Tax=Rhodococcus TaxID=1827 RepID=UPI001697650C|nr:tyrosine-protein phosphatase [Rhodococcus sp. (in: high G+C Gram-positive bacteria)]NLV80891.1 tyrosine-protein phosphatase [Rhodococcus sp. (in: high G+C Gram-positive bacteria)]
MTDEVDRSASDDSAFRIPSLVNLRDIGGGASRFGGVVRSGVLFRSTDLSRLTDTDRETLGALGITTVFDLRTAVERDERPDRLPLGARHVGLDVLADRVSGSIAASMAELVADPVRAAEYLGDGRAEQYLMGSYRDFVTLPSALASYRRLYTDLAHGDVPALVHCTAGKDRTGWAAAALLMFAGAADDVVFADYLRTNDELLPRFERMFSRFEVAGGDRGMLVAVLGVQRGYLEAAVEEMLTRYGTVEQYFAGGLGLDDDTLQALRTRIIDTGTVATRA